MKKSFEKLKTINLDYKATVDALAGSYAEAGLCDRQYNDEIKAQRLTERNVDYNARIDAAAEKALAEATLEIDKLRGAMRAYITGSDDAAALAAAQALVSAGVELSDTELAAFSEKGGFATLKLLEKHTGGKVETPDLEKFNTELREVQGHFNSIKNYRGGLAHVGPASPWGNALSPVVSNEVHRGLIDKFGEKLDEMAERWACLGNGG